MRPNHTLSMIVVGVAAAVMLFPPRLCAQPSDEADLAQVQGLWERKTGEDVPGMLRATKEIRGNRETVTYYGEGDKLLRAHEVDFKVERREGIRIFTFTNWTATEGPDKGHKSPAPVSYIYRADENTFVEVWGFLPGQEKRSPRVMMWVKKLSQTAEAIAEQQALQGRWLPASPPATATSADVPGDEIMFSGDDFTVKKAGHVHLSGVMRLNAAASPKAIDLIITQSPNGLKTGQCIHGIYEAKGTSLRWCSSPPNQSRPTDFAVREGSEQTFAELWRGESKP